MESAVTFESVNYIIDGLHILRDISGSFYKGKITTLVGPSGAGKTTLLKLCNGLLSPNSGRIMIEGHEINEYAPVDLRRLVGMTLQSAPMIGGTVFDNLSLPLDLRGKKLKVEEARVLLDEVGLEEKLLERNVKELSGGQRQKVSIARTLVNRPKILLLDEITSSLDVKSQKDIEELIVRINEKYSTTIIWITHNLEQALGVGTYSWVMMAGEVIEAGKSDLLLSPADERVKRFVRGEQQ